MDDAPSLTLPKATARGRVRWRRPKPPDKWRLWDLAWCVLLSTFAVIDWVSGDWVSAVVSAALAGICWRQYILTRRHPEYRRLSRIYLYVCIAWIIEGFTFGH